MKFVAENLKPGYVIMLQGTSYFSRLTRKAIGSEASHDGIVVSLKDGIMFGDCTIPFARVIPISVLEAEINKGKYTWAKVLAPAEFDPIKGEKASAWWITNVRGRVYDISIFLIVLLSRQTLFLLNVATKAALKQFLFSKYPALAALAVLSEKKEWGYWCTDGCYKAWMVGAGIDLWHKENPTPRTTEKRLEDGTFKLVPEAISNA